MTRQLIAFVDRSPEGREAEPDGQAPSALAHWSALEHARTGEFRRVILIAGARFRWDEVLDHVPDHPYEEAPPDSVSPPSEPPPGPPASAGSDSATDSPEPPASAGSDSATDSPEPPASAGTSDAPAATSADTPSESHTAGSTAPPPKPEPRPREPKKPPPKSVAEVRARLHHMAQTGHVDRAAIDKLCAELARELGVATVVVRVMPPFARDREQVSFIRSVLGMLEASVPAVLDFGDGPRMAAGLGLTLAHGLASLRPDVPLAELTMDRSRNLGFHPRSLLHSIEIQELWREVVRGATPAALVEHMRADNRLQGLAAPYQRYCRALEFGNPAEAARAARTVQQRLAELAGKSSEKDDWVAAIQPALEAMTGALVLDQPWSKRQLWMADASAKRGMHFLAALHIREALISGLLETYGQNAARGWAVAPADERGETRIRPREVMAVVLSDPHSAKLVADLGHVWQWVGNPRNRFVMTSPVAVDPALLRDGNHALLNLPMLARAILDENRMKAIVDVLPYEEAIKLALERNAVRVAPMRGRRGPRRGGAHDGPGGHDQSHEEGAEPGSEEHPGAESSAEAAAAASPPQGPPRPPRPPRQQGTRFNPRPDRRGPRPDRPPRPGDGPPRPREITAHGRPDGPRGPRRDSGSPESHPGSMPVGGVREVGRASSGLGNLGFALRNAGLPVGPRDRKDRPPRKDGDGGSDDSRDKQDSGKAALEAASDASVVVSPPSPPSHQPVEAPTPPPPAPDFDVAGPA